MPISGIFGRASSQPLASAPNAYRVGEARLIFPAYKVRYSQTPYETSFKSSMTQLPQDSVVRNRLKELGEEHAVNIEYHPPCIESATGQIYQVNKSNVWTLPDEGIRYIPGSVVVKPKENPTFSLTPTIQLKIERAREAIQNYFERLQIATAPIFR